MKCGTLSCDYRNSYGDCLSPFNCIFQEEGKYTNKTISVSDGKACVWTNNPSAVIKIGSLSIDIYNKTFTYEQIKNMKELFGWEVENLVN